MSGERNHRNRMVERFPTGDALGQGFESVLHRQGQGRLGGEKGAAAPGNVYREGTQAQGDLQVLYGARGPLGAQSRFGPPAIPRSAQEIVPSHVYRKVGAMHTLRPPWAEKLGEVLAALHD